MFLRCSYPQNIAYEVIRCAMKIYIYSEYTIYTICIGLGWCGVVAITTDPGYANIHLHLLQGRLNKSRPYTTTHRCWIKHKPQISPRLMFARCSLSAIVVGKHHRHFIYKYTLCIYYGGLLVACGINAEIYKSHKTSLVAHNCEICAQSMWFTARQIASS